jgi:hypothetical protein
MLLARERHWRYGQALFNHLLEVRPELAERVKGTDIDPFYLEGPAQDSNKWDRFIEFLESNWR